MKPIKTIEIMKSFETFERLGYTVKISKPALISHTDESGYYQVHIDTVVGSPYGGFKPSFSVLKAAYNACLNVAINRHYKESTPSAYDCTGQIFTSEIGVVSREIIEDGPIYKLTMIIDYTDYIDV